MEVLDIPWHPLMREALLASGSSPEKMLEEKYWQRSASPFMGSAYRLDVPYIFADARSGHIEYGTSGIEVRYRRHMGMVPDYRFWIVRKRAVLGDSDIPAAILAALPGQRLSRLIDIGGADEIVIAGVETNDEGDIVFHLENPAITESKHAA